MKKINDIKGIDLNRLSFYFKNNNRDFISVYILMIKIEIIIYIHLIKGIISNIKDIDII